MDQWLQNLDQNTVVIVPTRSLASNLNEQIATDRLANGVSVWEAPNIVIWRDYLQLLWQQNRANISNGSSSQLSVITQQQSLLLWTQIIAASRRDEQSLTLLNVQQTAKAVQRSWRLLHDWDVSIDTLANDHVADTQQFIEWVSEYRDLLVKRGFLDDQLLANNLLRMQLNTSHKKVIWYAYDLITARQRLFIELLESNGLDIEFHQTSQPQKQARSYSVYSDQQHELLSTFEEARALIEQDSSVTVNIVVPDLQYRQEKVRELARDIFYPGLSPLKLQQSSSVYRFSLGDPLKQWPSIETALTLIGALKSHIKVTDLSFILRNRFLRHCQTHTQECRIFDQWLKRQRLNTLQVTSLTSFYQQCLMEHQQRGKLVEQNGFLEFLQDIQQALIEMQALLSDRKESSGYAALTFTEWAQQITQWLNAWGWSTSIAQEEMNSVQYQLGQRWQALLKEYSELSVVQNQAGMTRALEVLQQMSNDAVFLPKAPASPILISGLYEAIGRPVDICYLISMDDQFPQPAQADSFIPNRLLQQANYPEANTQDSFQQSQKVMQSLLGSAQQVKVSYSRYKKKEGEIQYCQSTIFRDNDFIEVGLISSSEMVNQALESYQDVNGSALPTGQIVEGGSAIFKNQSNCAFKAFITHQLKFDREEEAEFGLDNLDRGNIVHLLLDRLWGQLQTQAQLKALNQSELNEIVQTVIDNVINDDELALTGDKKILLQHEKQRFLILLLEWLELEAARPTEFSVIEREEQGFAVFAGIRFRYIIDRLDMLADGRTAIIDYKTGTVARKDWLDERLKDPQLPLYALAHDEKKRSPASGIAFANVKRHNSKFISLCEADIFKKAGSEKSQANKEEVEWHENREKWPELFTKLAEDFLAGDAQVNPIDEKTCDYCDLQSVCRVSQFRREAG